MKVLLCSLALLACWQAACGHIHSQKIRHFERDRLTGTTWVCALVSSALIGACGVFPLLVNRWVRLDASCRDAPALKAVLSFAVGGLLGDVFLHLLPEAWGPGASEEQVARAGLWVLAGLLSFLFVEKVVKCTEREVDCSSPSETSSERTSELGLKHTANGSLNGLVHRNGTVKFSIVNGDVCKTISRTANGVVCKTIHRTANGNVCKTDAHIISTSPTPPRSSSKWLDKDVSGYLNLVANCTDNFTHGLAIAASYVASPMVGLFTTLAILCHEIPHEIGDFAILLNSGFGSWSAAKAQMVTACGGLVGVIVGLTAEHIGNSTSWLLPFTAGGFLYIALVSIVPSLLGNLSVRQTATQLGLLCVGVVVMAMVTVVEKKSCAHMPSDLLS